MKHLKWKFNIFLSFITVIGIYIFLTFDNNELNIFLNEDNSTNFKINVINTGKPTDNTGSKVVLLNNPVDKWVIPVDGNYTITTYYSLTHKAIDFYSYNGYDSKIKAANSGEVIGVHGGCDNAGSYCNGRGGNYIVIKHNTNNYYTVYMHLHNMYVKTGDKVNSGDTIASMGNTGYVIPPRTPSAPYNGTHLHFCLYKGEPFKGGYPINPMSLY